MKTYRRIYAIPDVHGRLDLLSRGILLMYQDGYDEREDLIVFTGDLIDRGPDSKSVIDLVQGLIRSGLAVGVRGNHEDFAIDTYLGTKSSADWIWYANGGVATMQSYPAGKMHEDHVRFLASLPLSLEIQGFFFSHAPVPREKARVGSSRFYSDRDFGMSGEPYTHWELTWHYFGPECEKQGGMMDVHEGPVSQVESGKHLIGVCGHIHRGFTCREVRLFPKYRMLDCGCGCFPTGSLAIHECLSGRTLYARPEDLARGSD